MTTRGAVFAAPRRIILLILLLALLISSITPVFASNNNHVDLTSAFFETQPSGSCSDHPAVFDNDPDMADLILDSYSLYFIQVNGDVTQLVKSSAGCCYYDLSSSFEEWSATEQVVREKSDPIFSAAANDYNSAKGKITLDGITLSNDADHLLFFISDDDGEYIAYLLVEWLKAGNTLSDKQMEPLTSLLASVTDKNEANWYQTGDYWNGNTYESSGFWAKFTAKDGPREQAQKDLKAATSEENIEAARAKLQAAIDQLIPADRLNTTPLYEAIQSVSGLDYNDLSLQAYTETSAALFRAGRTDAQKYLDSLFTGEEGNRKPSDKNKNTIENQAALDAAVANAKALPTLLVHQSLVSYSEQNAKNIQALAARYGAGENPGYTDESWESLQSVRTAALAYVKAHPVTSNLTRQENTDLHDHAVKLWNAICALKSDKEQISVTLTYTDDYHLRVPSSKQADKSGLTPGVTSYTLDSGATLRQLLKQVGYKYPSGDWAADLYPGFAFDADARRFYQWNIYVNGVQQNVAFIAGESGMDYLKLPLRDGDQVQITFSEAPSYAYNYIYRKLAEWDETASVLGTLRFGKDSSTSAEAGAELSLTVEGAKTAHLWSYNGSYAPYAGAKIAVYGPKTDAGYPAKATILDAVTDEKGKTSIKLYAEGTYLVTAFDPRENDESTSTFYSGMAAAPYLEVTVGASNDATGVKKELKTELDTIFTAYPQEQFRATAWEQLKAAYDDAIEVLNSSNSSVAEARAAQQTAIETIQKLQNEMLGDNQDALSRFRKYLAMLPDDTSKITSATAVQEAVKNLQTAYSALTSYQKSLLTGPEQQKYKAIVDYMKQKGDNLPAPESYKLNLVVKGDNEESTKILNKLYDSLRENPAKQDRGTSGGGDHTYAIPIATPFSFGTYSQINERFTSFEAGADGTIAVEPLTDVNVVTDLTYAAYFQTRNAIFLQGKDSYTTDSGWALTDENLICTKTGSTLCYAADGSLTLWIDNELYELKSVTYSGISKNDITGKSLTIYDADLDSNGKQYKGKDYQWINVQFRSGLQTFTMPYEDVTITISWAKAETLDQTKKAAEKAVLAEFNAYVKSDYTDENWTKLEKAKDDGLAAITASKTAADITTARKAAINAMAAIPTKNEDGKTGDIGKNYPFKNSKVVGRVHVIVENTTYLSDSLPASLKKEFINDWYDLTEDDSMMTVILKALEGKGYHWQGGADDYAISYLASVEKDGGTLAEFTGGGNSGWMGTLNDWFVNKGFTSFRASDNSLQDGDYIHVMYTTALGADLGGSWSNTSTTLKSLNVKGGTLSPASLYSGVTDYVLQITESDATVTVSYEPTNKNYQARMYLNNYNNENSRYASGSRMQVSSGDIVYIGVGEAGWPSMNEASPATKYTIRVVKQGNLDDLQAIVARLPDASKLTLADAEDVETAYSLYQALDERQKAGFGSANYDKLMACYKRLPILRAVSKVTTAANKLPQNPANLTLADKQIVADAQTALDELTALHAESEISAAMRKRIADSTAKISQLEVARVEALINALPDPITESDREAVVAARAAYNALTDKQKNAIGSLVYQKLLAAEAALKNQQPGEETNYSEYLRKALANIKKTVPTPTIGSSSGEWAVLALARGNADVLNSYYDGYYDRVVAYVRTNISSGKLNADKSTDNARIALALTAIGEDPTSVGGHNLLTALDDVTYDLKQGINGPIWALIALDSKNYTSSSRDELIEAILGNRTSDGGWALDGTVTDVDMTAMAIQALAPYYKSNKNVQDVVDAALAWLSTKQSSDGGFSSWGNANAESCAQVIVALSALNIDADTDSRFVKNGYSALENLLTFEQADGSFLHTLPGSDKDNNQMSSEQGTYALVAYDRFKTGKNSLYNMTDAVKRADASAQEVIDMIDSIGEVNESSYNAIAEARNAYNKLSAADKDKVENYDTLTAAEASYKEILKQKRTEQYKLLKAHHDELLNDKTKKYGTAAKKKLQSILQTAQKNMNAAESCERVTAIYDQAVYDLDAVKPGDIEVTFRLIGALEATQDVDLTTDSYLPEYVTWVPTKTYALQENATVYDLFTEAMSDAGLRYIGADSNYVSTIYAPSCLGSYALSEFTNGKKSGWMYTVNGTHPNQGLKNWTLNDNDVVVWHYVNDYSHEVADWFNDPNYPSLGNGTYYNGWLRAADISPEQYVNELLGKILKVGKNGTVEPKLTFQHIGKSVTFTFKPDTGYKVKDVKVNGKSVGAVKTYTIDKLTVSTRIEVEFTNGKLPFTDVRESDWFYEDVAFAYENGLFAGTSDTTFSPNASMTRAMLVTVLYRLEGQPAVNGRSGFSDVQYNGYYEDAVTWAADNGIVNGTSTTTFSPNANVTREQMAAILYRYAQHKKYNTAASSGLNGFTDHASVSGYAAASLEWAVAEKLVNGSAGKLMPTGNATRAQVAAILHRFVENVAKTTK